MISYSTVVDSDSPHRILVSVAAAAACQRGATQLLTNYKYVPQSKIEVIVEANRIRKEFAAGVMLQMGWDHMYAGKGNPVLGVRCLLMELSSDSL